MTKKGGVSWTWLIIAAVAAMVAYFLGIFDLLFASLGLSDTYEGETVVDTTTTPTYENESGGFFSDESVIGTILDPFDIF